MPKDSNAPYLQRRLQTNLSKLQSNLKAFTENPGYAATAKMLFHAKFVDASSAWAEHVAAVVIAARDSFVDTITYFVPLEHLRASTETIFTHTQHSTCCNHAMRAQCVRCFYLLLFLSAFAWCLVRIKPKKVTWHMATAKKPKKPK